MSFVHASYDDRSKVKVDIIFIPAIGADPKRTFARQVDREDHERIDFIIQDKLHPFAHIHLYDHLTPDERGLQIPRRPSRVITDERRIEDIYVDKEKAVSPFGVKDWAIRLLQRVRIQRTDRKAQGRPIIFICHSTGGNVLKRALIERDGPDLNDIAQDTIAITFFAVPHHGSTVLSKDRYVQEIQAHLGLKWAMSSRLRDDFRLDSTSKRGGDYNEELQSLNHRFTVDLASVKIYSYAEISDTNLTLLRSTKRDAEDQETVFRECIVDSRSGKLGTAQIPVEDEEHMQIDLSHVELPRFTGQNEQLEIYAGALKKLVVGYNDSDQYAYRKLRDSIMSEVHINVHQFYQYEDQMKILLAKPDLHQFLQYGPDKAMSDRLEGKDTDSPNATNGERPQLTLEAPTEPKEVPQFIVDTVDADGSSTDGNSDLLQPPQPQMPKNIHTHRPPELIEPPPFTDVNLNVAPVEIDSHKSVHFAGDQGEGVKSPRGPKKSAAIHLPEKPGFRWIHVPFTHPGWVHQILCTISEEKKDLKLHEHVLMDKIWLSQHNQARHASPHARFVRPSARFLYPQGTEQGEGLGMIPSSCSDVQVVAYLPYLHWDSYRNMKRRADITDLRLNQELASPIPSQVSDGKSTEYKLIWQGLTLDRPLHCRRTLDQYGYPALRNTKVRDDDQILYKRTKEDASQPPPIARSSKLMAKLSLQNKTQSSSLSHKPKVLMVDQMWLWVINGETVVTFFPGRENDDQNGYSRDGDVRSLIYQDINGDFANRCDDPYDFAALAMRHAIRALLAKATDRSLQVFRIFEEYISILTETQNNSWKEFRRMQHIPIHEMDSEKHINNEEDLNALLELRDIEDELKTIDKLLKEQLTVISEMLQQYISSLNPVGKGLKGTEFLTDIKSFIQEQRNQVKLMRDSTAAAQTAYKELLDMKQKQANVLEARIAGQQSQVAVRQSRSVLIFTIFTIIFLPLSFFASVFGINSREWSGQGNNYMPLSKIFTYMLTISFGCVVVALLAAFSRSARRHTIRLWRKLGARLVPSILKSSSKRNEPGPSPWEKWDKGNDIEKEAATMQQKRDDGRLSFLSRSHTMGYNEEKFEQDMQQRGGSFTGWWSHHHRPFHHDEDDGQMSPRRSSFLEVNGSTK